MQEDPVPEMVAIMVTLKTSKTFSEVLVALETLMIYATKLLVN